MPSRLIFSLTRDSNGECAGQSHTIKKSVGWPILKSKVFDRIIYIFICLNDESSPPTYFIANGPEIRDKIKEYKGKGGLRGILDYSRINTDEFCGRWDKIDAAIARTLSTSCLDNAT